jgi:dipeptidyl-peptidase 4
VLSLAAEQAGNLKSAVAAANRSRPDSIAVRSVLANPTTQPVIAEITEDAGAGSDGYARRRRTGVYRSIRMPVYDRFAAGRKEARAGGYLIPPGMKQVVGLLRRQGIGVGVITPRLRTSAQVFMVDNLVVDSLFEGHHPVRAEGQWLQQRVDTTVTAGWYLVRTDQPLGTLAAYLLEPASEDGVVTWNLLDRQLRTGAAYPILRVEAVAPSISAP